MTSSKECSVCKVVALRAGQLLECELHSAQATSAPV
jgi:hypothetical protein